MSYSFLSPADLQQMREEQKRVIAEIGTIVNHQRASYGPNGRGGITRVLTTVNSALPARLWISSGPNGTSEEVRFWAEQELSQTDAFVVVAWDTDVRVEDLFVFDNREFRVVGVQNKDAHNTATRCRVEAMR